MRGGFLEAAGWLERVGPFGRGRSGNELWLWLGVMALCIALLCHGLRDQSLTSLDDGVIT
jgi:hypothetical protein